MPVPVLMPVLMPVLRPDWFSECGMCQVPCSCVHRGSLFSPKSLGALHNGFRGQIVIKCVWRDRSLIQIHEINRPPSLPDMVSAVVLGRNSV
jgi:hypothetical protein